MLGDNDYGGPLTKINVLDNLTFTNSDWVFEPKFEYIQKTDLIRMTTKEGYTMFFRRVKPTDRVDIVADDGKFEEYFKTLFFEKYIMSNKNLKIDRLWIG